MPKTVHFLFVLIHFAKPVFLFIYPWIHACSVRTVSAVNVDFSASVFNPFYYVKKVFYLSFARMMSICRDMVISDSVFFSDFPFASAVLQWTWESEIDYISNPLLLQPFHISCWWRHCGTWQNIIYFLKIVGSLCNSYSKRIFSLSWFVDW